MGYPKTHEDISRIADEKMVSKYGQNYLNWGRCTDYDINDHIPIICSYSDTEKEGRK